MRRPAACIMQSRQSETFTEICCWAQLTQARENFTQAFYFPFWEIICCLLLFISCWELVACFLNNRCTDISSHYNKESWLRCVIQFLLIYRLFKIIFMVYYSRLVKFHHKTLRLFTKWQRKMMLSIEKTKSCTYLCTRLSYTKKEIRRTIATGKLRST